MSSCRKKRKVNNLLLSNKKAVSEMVGYVLLIVIAVGLSVAVYSFLRIYVPKEKPACEESINLIVQDYSCSVAQNNLTLTLSNKGLFKVNAAFIRLGLETQKVKPQINKNNFYIYGPDGKLGLNPGESFTSVYIPAAAVKSGINYGLEIEPAQVSGNTLIACENSIITQTITCT